MYLRLDFESEVPIYEQLKLASDIGINMHTVNKAYQQLKQEGFLLIHRQKGVVVNPEPPKLDDQYEEKLLETLRPLIAEAICRGMDKEAYLLLWNKIFSELSVGDDDE